MYESNCQFWNICSIASLIEKGIGRTAELMNLQQPVHHPAPLQDRHEDKSVGKGKGEEERAEGKSRLMTSSGGPGKLGSS